MGLGGGWQYYPDWTSPGADGTTMLGKFDALITQIRQAGLKIVALVDGGTYFGSQSQWNANNQETGQGNGDNTFAQNLGTTFGFLSEHYAGQIDAWEIWNEPNAWTRSVGFGGSYIYPSNFAWVLKHIKDNQKDTAPLVSGGIFGFTDSSGLHTGKDYLDAVIKVGQPIWGGPIPVQFIGSHFYVDGGGYVQRSTVQAVINDMASYGKKVFVTEWGWQVGAVSEAIQASNLVTANDVMRRSGAVANAFWFKMQDSPNLFYGLFRADGSARPALQSYQGAAYLEQSAADRWGSFFVTLQKVLQPLFPNIDLTTVFPVPRTGTGIYNAWYNALLNGKQLGPATSDEYPTVNWSGVPIIAQDFGSARIEWLNGAGHAYGPYGQIF